MNAEDAMRMERGERINLVLGKAGVVGGRGQRGQRGL